MFKGYCDPQQRILEDKFLTALFFTEPDSTPYRPQNAVVAASDPGMKHLLLNIEPFAVRTYVDHWNSAEHLQSGDQLKEEFCGGR